MDDLIDLRPVMGMKPIAYLPLEDGETVASMAHCLLNSPQKYGYLLIATSASRLFLLQVEESGDIKCVGPLSVTHKVD